MLIENDPIRKLLNVQPYYDLGFYGQGINCGSFEQQEAAHGYEVAFAFKEIAPQANLISLDGIADKYQFILDNNIIIASRSIELDPVQAPENLKFPIDILDHCLLLHAMGNNGARVDNTLVDRPEWFGTAAVSMLDLTRAPYSNQSDDLLMAAPGTVYVKYGTGSSNPKQGTSFTDFLDMGALAVAQSFVMAKRGFPMSGWEMVEFIKDNRIDVAPAGFDVNTGYGVFALPDPEDFDVYKYITVIEMTIGDKNYTVNGEPKVMDTAPRISDSRTLVPIRFIAEALGAKVDWNDAKKKVTIRK